MREDRLQQLVATHDAAADGQMPEAALLAARATQGGEQAGQFGALNLIHEGRAAD